MIRLRVLDAARQEFAEAVRWYHKDDPDVARDMVAEYIARVRLARQFPSTGAIESELEADVEVCRILLKRFPYAVFVARFPDELVIVAVAHQHREPGYLLEAPSRKGQTLIWDGTKFRCVSTDPASISEPLLTQKPLRSHHFQRISKASGDAGTKSKMQITNCKTVIRGFESRPHLHKFILLIAGT